jgi:hypothetical protein
MPPRDSPPSPPPPGPPPASVAAGGPAGGAAAAVGGSVSGAAVGGSVSGVAGGAAAAAGGSASGTAGPPAKRQRGQAEFKAGRLLTQEDLDAGTPPIHWNGLLAMLTKITSVVKGAELVQVWLATHKERRGGEKTREAMLAEVKGHIKDNKEPKLLVHGSASIQNVVAYSKHTNKNQPAAGVSKTARWYYISGEWYSNNPDTKKGRPKTVAATPAAPPAATAALAKVVPFIPPPPAMLSSAPETDQVSFSSSSSGRNPQQATLREYPKDICTGGNLIMPVVREGDIVRIVPTEAMTEAHTGVVWVKVKPLNTVNEGWIRRKWLRRACKPDDHR